MLSKQFCKPAFNKLTPEQRMTALANLLVEESIKQNRHVPGDVLPIYLTVTGYFDYPDTIDVSGMGSGNRVTGETTQLIKTYMLVAKQEQARLKAEREINGEPTEEVPF